MPPYDQTRDMLLWAVLPALASSAIIMAALERFGGAKQAPAASALAFIVGVVLGQWLHTAGPALSKELQWPTLSALQIGLTVTGGESAWNRLPWAVLAALTVERIARVLDTHFEDGWFVRAAASLGIAWWLIPETAREETMWLAPAFAAVVFVEWALLERVANQPADGGVPICLAFVFIFAGLALLYAGIARWMDIAIVCAAALGGIGLIAGWRRADASGAMPGVAVVLPTLMLMGQLESAVTKLPWSVLALVAVAPLMLGCAWPLRHRSGVIRHLARLVLVLIPLIAALVVAELTAGPLDFGEILEEGG